MSNFVPLFGKNLHTYTGEASPQILRSWSIKTDSLSLTKFIKFFHKLIKAKCDGFRLHSTHPTISLVKTLTYSW